MNPSGAPSLIERFTSLVGHCILLNALSDNRISVAQVGQTTVAGYPGVAKPEQQAKPRALQTTMGRLNYRLGFPWF